VGAAGPAPSHRDQVRLRRVSLVGKLARQIGINATGGSTSVIDAWEVVRTAAATARASLLGAAALQWKLPVDELSVRDGVVHHGSGRSATYGQLARFAAATPPGSVQVKTRESWRVIGQAAPRLDVPPCRSTGSKSLACAGHGCHRALPGERSQGRQGPRLPRDRKPERAENGAARTVEAWYRAPYLAHMTLEPMNCTAQVAHGEVVIWAPNASPVDGPGRGGPGGRRACGPGHGAGAIAGWRLWPAAGGRRCRASGPWRWMQVARRSSSCGRVRKAARMISIDHARGASARVIDDAGQPASFRITSAGDAITPRWIERAIPALASRLELTDKRTAEGLFDLPYAFPSRRMGARGHPQRPSCGVLAFGGAFAQRIPFPRASWTELAHSVSADR